MSDLISYEEKFSSASLVTDGKAELSITLSSNSASTTSLLLNYSYHKYDYISTPAGILRYRGLKDSPSKFVFYCPGTKKSISINYREKMELTEDFVRFFLESCGHIYVEVYNNNGNRVSVVANNVDSNSYRHEFDSTEVQTLVEVYLKLKSFSSSNKFDSATISTIESEGAYFVNYLRPEIYMDTSTGAGLCIDGGSLYLTHTFKRDSESCGPSDYPDYIILYSDSSEDFCIVSASMSGKIALSDDVERYILSLPDNASIVFDYRYSNGNKVNTYYKDLKGDRLSEVLQESTSVAELKSFIALYDTLYYDETKQNVGDDFVAMGYNSTVRFYPDYSNDIYTDDIDSGVYLEYKTYSDSNFGFGLSSEPSWIIMSRSDRVNVVLSVDNSGKLELGNNVLRFIEESADDSIIEISYYSSRGNRITYYRYENGNKRGDNSFVDTLDVNSAKKLINYYCSKKDPLDVWEINKNYTFNWILGLEN